MLSGFLSLNAAEYSTTCALHIGDKSALGWRTRVRACNYVKIATGRNFLPVLKIVTCTVQAALYVNVAMRARDQCLFLVLAGNSALTMGFYWSYTLLL